MAKMVTRTVVTTNVTVLCIDVNAQQTFKDTFVMQGSFKDDKKILKILKDENETENVKIVSIISKDYDKKLYGMPEDVFIENAQPMEEEQAKREQYKKDKE